MFHSWFKSPSQYKNKKNLGHHNHHFIFNFQLIEYLITRPSRKSHFPNTTTKRGVSTCYWDCHEIIICFVHHISILQNWFMFNHMIDFFPIFLMFFKWQSFVNLFVQIWQYSRFKSRNFLAPFHIVGNCDDFHKFVMKFCLAKKTPKNKEFAAKCFSQMAKFWHKKIIGSHILISYYYKKTCLLIFIWLILTLLPRGALSVKFIHYLHQANIFWGIN